MKKKYDVCVHKDYRLLTEEKLSRWIVTCFYVALQQKLTKNTIITSEFETCCYFGQISGEKHVLNFGKELILQFMFFCFFFFFCLFVFLNKISSHDKFVLGYPVGATFQNGAICIPLTFPYILWT